MPLRRPLNERTVSRSEPRSKGTTLASVRAFPTASAEQFRQFQAGDRIEAKHSDDKWYPAQLLACNERTGQARIQWSDSSDPALVVSLKLIRAVPSEVDPLDELVELGLKGDKKHRADPKALEEGERFRSQMATLSAQAGESIDDFRSDISRKVMLQALYSVTAELIPTAANKYATEGNESSAYAYNALANKLQELSRELQSLDSLEDQAQHIVGKLLAPMLVRCTSNLINSLSFASARVDDLQLPPAKAESFKLHLQEMVRSHVTFVEQSSLSLEEQIVAYLIGDVPVKKRSGKNAQPKQLEYAG